MPRIICQHITSNSNNHSEHWHLFSLRDTPYNANLILVVPNHAVNILEWDKVNVATISLLDARSSYLTVIVLPHTDNFYKDVLTRI